MAVKVPSDDVPGTNTNVIHAVCNIKLDFS